MNYRTPHSISRYVTLAPLAFVCLFESLLLIWLMGSHRLEATHVSVAVALLVLGTGLLPALIRPGQLTALAGCIATLLASIVIAPVDLLALPASLSSPMLFSLPGGIILRLVCLALLGPALVHFTALFLSQQQLSQNQIGLSIAVGVLLICLLLWLPHPIPLIATAMLIIWFALLVSRAILHLVRAQTAQARLLLATILAAELPLLLRPILVLIGISIPYELILVTQLFLPIGIGYSILRHDLFGIDALLRRALAYTLLSVVVLVLYFSITAVLTLLLAVILPQARGLAVVIGLFSAAAAFAPVRGRTQALIDQAFYPERSVFRMALSQAHSQLAQVVQRDQVLALLESELPARLGATRAELTLTDAIEASNTTLPAGWSMRLQAGETMLGYYWLGSRRSGLPYDQAEQAALTDLIRQAALALAYTDTLEQLQALNRDLAQRVAGQVQQIFVQQRDLLVADERRRLARDLHDSVTQTLFSLHLSTRAIRGMVPRESSAAQHALIEQEQAARQALAEMRELLTQLRTPTNQSGDTSEMIDLAAELRLQCAELQRRGELDITLDAPQTALLPSAHTVGLAQIAREALNNILKHSGTRCARVILTSTPIATMLSIADDGRGFEIARVVGEHYGIRGMRERADACGAVLEVLSSTGQGTIVQASIQETGVGIQNGA